MFGRRSAAVRSESVSSLAGRTITAERAAALIDAGNAAFTQAHTVLLTTTAGVIGVLVIIVFFALAGDRQQNTAPAPLRKISPQEE